jgi:hypothetical protein
MERWGRAMVLVVGSPAIASDGFLGAALAGAIAVAAGRDVAITSLGRETDIARYLICQQSTAVKAKSLVSQGKSWGDVLAIQQKGAP